MQFKAGDRVRCIKTPDGEDMIGWVGTVKGTIDAPTHSVFVAFDLDQYPMWDWLMSPDELELVK